MSLKGYNFLSIASLSSPIIFLRESKFLFRTFDSSPTLFPDTWRLKRSSKLFTRLSSVVGNMSFLVCLIESARVSIKGRMSPVTWASRFSRRKVRLGGVI